MNKIKKNKLDINYFINYKNIIFLKKYINDNFKIIPKRINGNKSKIQRKISKEIKKARYIGLIPYTDRHLI
ncbi:30S ribosomal protein S18 [endosymbiont of Sipalinus gigas]|uniref:30S ribosomal protein S18 n=1 Tax=endosymbiont of Sipalinus gigas TaxID=1972134 RepID=UPI000DC7297F|nr:30S ribosomal protein S18 [endosymbiont of Sipalinus gigas]BBA85337.1 30S ribosomal protein S18 [endosymbiont of Sipalinus gigas]